VVLLEATRPRPKVFSVRIFADGFTPPEADVVASALFYGADVALVGRRLEEARSAGGLWPTPELRYVCYWT
jgi:hypothetical protein